MAHASSPDYEWFRPRRGEQVLTLQEFRRRVDKEVAYNTLLSWAKVGRRGIKMRVCMTPTGLGTSLNEYQRFIQRLQSAIPIP